MMLVMLLMSFLLLCPADRFPPFFRFSPNSPLKQPEAAEARVSLAADHQMIVYGDAQRLGGGLHLARHLDVVARDGLGSPLGRCAPRFSKS
jgi:hypothetical protein